MLGQDYPDVAEREKQAQTEATSEDTPEVRAKKNFVKDWQDKIKIAKKKYNSDFKRMVDNQDFVAGIQWQGQNEITYDRIVVNLTLQAVNHGVAMLYARDPRFEARRKKRLNYRFWDGKLESVMQAMQLVAMSQLHPQLAAMLPPDIPQMLQDFSMGRLREQMVEKVAQTLCLLFQYQIDNQYPCFKTQMKQLVRRVRVCGVGYIRVNFERGYETELTQSETRLSVMDRAKTARSILERLEKDELREDAPEIQQLKALVNSMGLSINDTESVSMQERLVFDFPKATSIIPDPSCTMLKGFVGAHWIVEELYYPLWFVNAFFETNVKPDAELKLFTNKHIAETANENNSGLGDKKAQEKKKVRLWRVYDLDNKEEFIICDGHKDFIQEPEPVEATKGFWRIVPVTFNDIEADEDCKATVFPPSDVDVIKPLQKEWNRIKQALRKHRRANGPRYLYPDGSLEEEDLDNIVDSEEQEFIKLKSIQPGADPSKVVVPLQVVDVKQELYETDSISNDVLMATGKQDADIGPAQPNVPATNAMIAEQAHRSVTASDVDGLDDSLTEVAKIGGELALRNFSSQTVTRVVGDGAAWPDQNKQDFLNEIELEVVAASSGRPNKAVEIANWERLAPVLVNAGANPQAVIRETIKRLDDRMEPADFFPVQPPPMPMQPQQPQQAQRPQGKVKPKQPLQANKSGGQVPLLG
jgi:hypothetical protein